jgi:hypothetical protein
MADINQVITLGIGTPAGIPEFLTFGLQIGAEAEQERNKGSGSYVWNEYRQRLLQEDDAILAVIMASMRVLH